MWTKTTRNQYEPNTDRYASDTTDDEWAVIAPLLPPANVRGRPRKTDPRVVVESYG